MIYVFICKDTNQNKLIKIKKVRIDSIGKEQSSFIVLKPWCKKDWVGPVCLEVSTELPCARLHMGTYLSVLLYCVYTYTVLIFSIKDSSK